MGAVNPMFLLELIVLITAHRRDKVEDESEKVSWFLRAALGSEALLISHRETLRVIGIS